MIYYKDGAKMMRPVHTRKEYLALRNGGEQQQLVQRIRNDEDGLKHKLLQLNYSCLPNDDGTLKGSKRMSTTVGMDIDFVAPKELSSEEQQAWLSERMARVPELVMNKKDELGLQMFERSATKGYHLVFQRRADLDQVGNLKWASELLNVAYDAQAKDITRVFFTTTEAELIYLDDSLFTIEEFKGTDSTAFLEKDTAVGTKKESIVSQREPCNPCQKEYPKDYHGIPFKDIIRKYWEVNNRGFEPTQGDRDTLTYQLACDLRHICGRNFEWLDQVIPCYDGFPIEEKRAKIKSALSSEFNGFPQRLRNTLNALQMSDGRCQMDDVENVEDECSMVNVQCSMKKLPQGVRESIDAVGPALTMPIVTAICPCIGTLATGVTLDVHGQKKGLNLISYIAGDFASGKGGIDPVVEAWMSEVVALDKMYQMQEDEWRAKKRAAKNKKEQPEEPKLPVRCLTLNNTVANLAERLANTEGKHAFSFTPEADTVAQKWKSTMSDFSVMLRQSYDGTKYEREARSADAVNVHIDKLLWNVTMCGTPDALYRVVSNYTDGFQSRIAVARTPDNTFAPLEDKPPVLTDRQRERIQQIAHLLPLMYGEVVLPKLEQKGREWVERIRLETMKNDDRTRARQRFRVCVTAQRMTCCLMLCKVCETLIQKHGLSGAEAKLKQQPSLWKEMLLKAQTPTMMVNGERQKRGKNDSIFERLDIQFTFEQAMQHSVAVKGANVNHNTVRQMLKNWRKQRLVVLEEDGNYRKL